MFSRTLSTPTIPWVRRSSGTRPDATPDRIRRFRGRGTARPTAHLAGLECLRPEDDTRELGPAGTHDAGQSDDLPRTDDEIDVGHPTASARDPLEAKGLPARGAYRVLVDVVEDAPHHEGDDSRSIELSHGARRDALTVAQHGDPVGQLNTSSRRWETYSTATPLVPQVDARSGTGARSRSRSGPPSARP